MGLITGTQLLSGYLSLYICECCKYHILTEKSQRRNAFKCFWQKLVKTNL